MTTIASFPYLGIGFALLSAALLTVGNHLQSLGVAARVRANPGAGAAALWTLARQPLWVIGSALFGLAILAQLAALAFAPLIVVQPVGVAALVFSSLLTAVITRTPPRLGEIGAIALSVVSLGVFVWVAAAVSTQATITDAQLIAVLAVLGVVLAATGAAFAVRRGRGLQAGGYVILGGLFSGFVATLGKTVILRVQTAVAGADYRLDENNLLTLACLLAIVVAGALSITFVQVAHTVASPQLVVAGLTVVDPFVAVVMGITVLGEAAGAPPWSFVVFVIAGAGALAGVWLLARAGGATDAAVDAASARVT
ncbi:multidrug DMT transporter permease [Microbacterium aurantiacum]|uniref:Multidrug DMT transporter permease n=1 Tax=Microbacterium aurantiacum TaxID=162393 RepID=A0ABT8FUH6_9MICO|nr:multidrug DMT transporter permease [Microbacterium aurantiacum]MDN4464850.1 multidrug DMT transporter permease [Microbacterium aurantiacum]